MAYFCQWFTVFQTLFDEENQTYIISDEPSKKTYLWLNSGILVKKVYLAVRWTLGQSRVSGLVPLLCFSVYLDTFAVCWPHVPTVTTVVLCVRVTMVLCGSYHGLMCELTWSYYSYTWELTIVIRKLLEMRPVRSRLIAGQWSATYPVTMETSGFHVDKVTLGWKIGHTIIGHSGHTIIAI